MSQRTNGSTICRRWPRSEPGDLASGAAAQGFVAMPIMPTFRQAHVRSSHRAFFLDRGEYWTLPLAVGALYPQVRFRTSSSVTPERASLNQLAVSPNSKLTGAYYTPPDVVESLVRWATKDSETAVLLDPSCGDGRFIERRTGAVGVDVDRKAAAIASDRCPRATIVNGDFFQWAHAAPPRFDAVAGNPPFIRYQRFAGEERERALEYCASRGVALSALSSSWAFFVIAASSLLKPGGRLAFVVPCEIGYAVYARPVLRYLLASFARVELLAPRTKLFPELSEECWLLRCDGYSGSAHSLCLKEALRFEGTETKWESKTISLNELEAEAWRIRPFLLPRKVRQLYETLKFDECVHQLGDLADVGIGYVSGANQFFHLRPSRATELGIPSRFLRPTVRSNRDLNTDDVNAGVVRRWLAADRAALLLNLPANAQLPSAVGRYLDTAAARAAKLGYKCRGRNPWYAVPDVRTPDAFLSIMADQGPRLVGNSAKCTCTNSIHAVKLKNGVPLGRLLKAWHSPLTQLSSEVEGHHLGGGMLKVEPNEAKRILVPIKRPFLPEERELLERGLQTLRSWRHALAS